MKTLLLPLALLLTAHAAPAQTAPAAERAVMKDGHMMTMQGGHMAPLTADMPLTNGATVRPNGTLLLPGGQWMPLRDGEQVNSSGMVAPGPRPAQRRVTRFNKHVSNGQLKPAR